MQEEFLKCIENMEYIPSLLYEKIKNSNIVPKDFNLEKYNNEVIEKLYKKNYEYLKNIYKGIDNNIVLDDEQIKAILTDEYYTLIIAGAGTGKTTTMAAKVKYLVDKKHVNPEKILVMSFTKKATLELANRINIDFNLPVNTKTFHSLGFSYLKEIYHNRKCYVVDSNDRIKIFLDYFKEQVFPYKAKVQEIMDLFTKAVPNKNWLFGSYFKNNYQKYQNFNDYFLAYIDYKKSEIKDFSIAVNERIEKDLNNENIYTINNELVKSKGEAIIANFLYKNNIEYSYEKLYEEFIPNNIPYRPDFTLDLGGEKIYVEYFGLSTYKDNILRYEKIKKIKEEYHQKNHNKFIKIDYKPNEIIEETLKEELLKYGFILKPKSDEEIYEDLLKRNQTSQIYPFCNLLYKIIDQIKAHPDRENYYNKALEYINNFEGKEKEELLKQLNYFHEFYVYYQTKLFKAEKYGFDFSDMLYYANQYIETLGSNTNLKFDYIIIDEYQDISQVRYEFTKKIAEVNNAKVVAVGDDFQSIFAFAGSKIEYIYNFSKLFQQAKILKIRTTYRNSQELINYSGDFIMRNPLQIKKELISNKNVSNPVRFIMYDDNEEYLVLKKLILDINSKHPSHKILILGRTNEIIRKCFKEEELIKGLDTKLIFIGHENIDINAMTMHKSKGLTSDEVIIIGLNNNFPSDDFQTYWLINLFKFGLYNEPISYAEERRLFYVALTRTKNEVYLLVNNNPKHRSPFVDEIYRIINNNG